MENYVDETSALSLDQRLNIGEALSKVVQALGQALTGETAQAVTDACLEMAGRRERRTKDQTKRNREDHNGQEEVGGERSGCPECAGEQEADEHIQGKEAAGFGEQGGSGEGI